MAYDFSSRCDLINLHNLSFPKGPGHPFPYCLSLTVLHGIKVTMRSHGSHSDVRMFASVMSQGHRTYNKAALKHHHDFADVPMTSHLIKRTFAHHYDFASSKLADRDVVVANTISVKKSEAKRNSWSSVRTILDMMECLARNVKSIGKYPDGGPTDSWPPRTKFLEPGSLNRVPTSGYPGGPLLPRCRADGDGALEERAAREVSLKMMKRRACTEDCSSPRALWWNFRIYGSHYLRPKKQTEFDTYPLWDIKLIRKSRIFRNRRLSVGLNWTLSSPGRAAWDGVDDAINDKVEQTQ
ncbi:hypothetical protein EAI_00219 [Harpegnathos saltator]|uniref:Uncharacterized protein n=1 Tax=Harpegnathos saltator TaxID=610380 RepID=E2BP94_HARSA|nr:hypothetical protein EAI_00219 [Harpegnathos saltator]